MAKTPPKLYFDSCCFIDIVREGSGFPLTEAGRTDNVFFYKNLLKASVDGDLVVYTSYLSIVECLSVKDEKGGAVITEEVKRLFNSVLLSGRAGVTPVLPTKVIIDFARDLWWTNEIKLKAYDALHIATALDRGCAEFITTDRRSIDKDDNISKLLSLGLRVIEGKDTKYLPARYQTPDLFSKP